MQSCIFCILIEYRTVHINLRYFYIIFHPREWVFSNTRPNQAWNRQAGRMSKPRQMITSTMLTMATITLLRAATSQVLTPEWATISRPPRLLSLRQRQLPQVSSSISVCCKLIDSFSATTTLESDGTSHTQTQPYNPASDPPPATETIRTHEEPSNAQALGPEDHGLRHSTSGGRPIPPRSELRIKQPSPQPVSNRPVPPEIDTPDSPYRNSNAEPTTPISPASSSNYSRPLGSHGGRFSNAVKGIHGASEALRGSVNSTIAKGVGDQADYDRQIAIKQQGMREFTDSGFREKAEGRLRRRSASRELRSGVVDGGLERVDERVVNI